jgi:shikimate dehydrogenase
MASRSPWLHQQEATAQGLDLTYEPFDFTDHGWEDATLPALLRDLQAQGFCGVNITYPFKQVIIGAVNTVAMRDGRLIGHNTDMPGFRDSFVTGLPDAATGHVLQLGAGGAGAAVASALMTADIGHLHIADVDASRAAALAARLADRFGTDGVSASDIDAIDTAAVDGIVNSTPMGMAAHPGSPIPEASILPPHWVADIVYFPLETEFLRLARAKGCRTLNGSGTVIAQAALAFEIITGHPADKNRMRQSFF